jgi:DNA-directed RNA polymerase specialized sigma24 family protein
MGKVRRKVKRNIDPENIPVPAIDYLLYNLHYLKREVDILQPATGGLVRVPAKDARLGNPVEKVAIKRAELSMVLDAVDFAWRHFTPELRRIARAKYRRGWTNQEVAKRYYLSLSTVTRRLTSIRAAVAGSLASVPDAILTSFWRQIDLLEDA